MSNEKNKRHKRNRNKKRMAFYNTKAAFVAGIVVIITVLNDAVGLIVSIPFWIEAVEVGICWLMFYIALATDKMDTLLRKNIEGVERFGSFLTVYSIVIFLLEKILLRNVAEKVITPSIFDDKLFVFITFLSLAIVGIGGAVYLLVYKYPKET